MPNQEQIEAIRKSLEKPMPTIRDTRALELYAVRLEHQLADALENAVGKMVHTVEIFRLKQENKKLKARVELLEAGYKLIAFPELQSDYTPQQLARHTLRIEPLQPKIKQFLSTHEEHGI